MSRTFFDLKSTHNPFRWHLPVAERLCVGPVGNKFLFGGVGLGAAVAAMEAACDRPLIWATAQYLSYSRPPSIVDLDVSVPAHGKYTTQARVVAHVGDAEILTVNAALGRRPSDIAHQWAKAPVTPPPEDCEVSERWRTDVEDLHRHFEVRVALGRHGRAAHPDGPSEDGRVVLWIRPPEGTSVDSAILAVMADHVPSGVGPALGRNAGGNSLDNTLRLITITPTDWVLCDVTVTGVAHGVAHGAMRLFSQDGQLMATASQSMILRIRDGG